jgi:hypothetical protein
VPPKSKLRKIIDEERLVWCARGTGLIREEVWVDGTGEVGRYNLAFINHFMTRKDNGRVLGYDSAHGEPHRHFYGVVETIKPESYDVLFERFLGEVRILRKETW